MDDTQFKAFLTSARERAEKYSVDKDTDAEVKKTLLDLMQAIQSFEAAKSGLDSQSADARVLKKRYEQSKTDIRTLEKRVEAIKASLSPLIETVQNLGLAAGKITDATIAAKVRQEMQKIAKIVVDASKL